MNRSLLLCLIMLAPALVAAHHATTVAYDTKNIGTIEGKVVEVFWQNPHVVLTIERTSASGVSELWKIESGSPNSLARIGIGREIVAVGDRVTLLGALSRQGLPAMAAYTMTLADGMEVPLWPQRAVEIGRDIKPAPFSSTAVAAGEREANGIFRVWSRTGTGLQGEPELTDLTDAALASRRAWDPLADDPALRCEPPGMPSMMNNPYPIEFVDEGDFIRLRLEEWDGVRMIDMRPGATTEGKPRSKTGYSVGRWDGRTLVVTTAQISDPYFDDLGTPQSDQSRIVERFTLSDDETRLDYSMVVTDPRSFATPVTQAGHWNWVAGEQIKTFNCSVAP